MIDQNRLQEFTRTLQKYKAGKAALERRVVAAESWWRLRNRALEKRPADESFHSVSGWLHNVIVSKHADAMDAFPEPVILPREPGDAQEAAMLSAVVPCVLERNRFEQVYDAAMWQKLKTGTAAYRVVWDGELLGGLGDIRIERADLLNLFWEPGVDDIQKSRCLFYTQLEDEDALVERWPQLRGRLRGDAFRATRFVYDDAVDLSGKVTVVEVYYKKRGVLHYCKYVGDTVLYATEDELASPESVSQTQIEAQRQRVRFGEEEGRSGSGAFAASYERRGSERERASSDEGEGDRAERKTLPSSGPAGHLKVNCRAAAREAPLGGPPEGEGYKEIGLYDHGLYPFVLDPLFPVEGSPCGYGFVDLCQNGQTAIDLLRTAFIKNTMVGATPRFFQRIDGSVNEEEFADLSRALVHVTGNLGEDSLRPIPSTPLSGAWLQVLNSTIAELRETSGNTETASGVVHSGVTAASAIAALQEASSKGSRDASRASYVAFGRIVELCIELIRQFYTQPRRFRITGALGADAFVSYSNAGLQARPAWPEADGLDGAAAPLGGVLRLPVFDVKVTAQKRSSYARLSQNELAMQLYRLGLFEPGRETQALQCLELMDFDGLEELKRRLLASSGLRERLRALETWKALALALARRYRPDMAAGLEGSDPGAPMADPAAAPAMASPPPGETPQGGFSCRDAAIHLQLSSEARLMRGDPAARAATAERAYP